MFKDIRCQLGAAPAESCPTVTWERSPSSASSTTNSSERPLHMDTLNAPCHPRWSLRSQWTPSELYCEQRVRWISVCIVSGMSSFDTSLAGKYECVAGYSMKYKDMQHTEGGHPKTGTKLGCSIPVKDINRGSENMGKCECGVPVKIMSKGRCEWHTCQNHEGRQ